MSFGLLFELYLLGLWILIGILHAKLGDEDFHIEVVIDLLTIQQELLHLETALTELLLQVELLIFVFTHAHVTEGVFSSLVLVAFLLFLWFGWGLNCIWVGSREIDGLLDECLHHEDIQIKLLANACSLLFLA